MHNYAETCKDISSYISMYNFFIYLLPLKSYFCDRIFKGILHENDAFPKGTSLYGNVRLHVYFHLNVR